jgi:hypothetical protein
VGYRLRSNSDNRNWFCKLRGDSPSCALGLCKDHTGCTEILFFSHLLVLKLSVIQTTFSCRGKISKNLPIFRRNPHLEGLRCHIFCELHIFWRWRQKDRPNCHWLFNIPQKTWFLIHNVSWERDWKCSFCCVSPDAQLTLIWVQDFGIPLL